MHLTRINYFNILLALIPISFIAGNLIINLNIALITLSTIFLYNKRLFEIKLFFLDKLLIVFFFLIILSGLINTIELIEFKKRNNIDLYSSFVKSVYFLKYLFFYFCLRFLFEKETINLKFFFITSLFCVIFVSFDLFYQHIFGQDIFGFKIDSGRKLSGPFDDELIAGSYLQRFSLFAFFTIPLFLKSFSKKYLLPIIFLLFMVVFSGIIISGNRFPLILFLLSIFLLMLFEKKVRKYLLIFLISFLITFLLIFNLSTIVNKNFKTFYNQISSIGIAIVDGDFKTSEAPLYLKEFYSSYHTWSMNKFIGGGIKNFRLYCHFRKDRSVYTCNMHPHNYYLEILTETGLIGFINVLIIIYILTNLSFYKRYFKNTTLKQNNLIVPFIFLFITEMFPIRSSGSFFTTGNAVYLFMLIGIIIGLVRRNDAIENVK